MSRVSTLIIAILFNAMTAIAQPKEDSRGFTVGGYGEATYSYNFFSNNPYRYMYPDRYRNQSGNAQFDLPHVVIMLGKEFGKGWSMGTEIEFEHGGVEASIEVEGDEAIEIEHEIERGGEVFLEQFWIQKSFSESLNARAGMIIVPVGLINTRHEPDKFFTVFRQEGETTILPSTWHQIGVSLWGRIGNWRYEAQLLPGLNYRLFSNSGWISGASASPYEYTVGNRLAAAVRIDNYSISNLRLGVSGYAGGVNNDAFPTSVSSNGKVTKGVDGTVFVATADYEYKGKHVVSRGNADFGYLENAAAIGTSNKNSDNSTFSPYQHSFVGKNAFALGTETGVDLLSFKGNPEERLFLFGRYEYYDSYVPSKGQTDYLWTDCSRIAAGINYQPISQVIIKAEFSERILRSRYNNEPSVRIGICYTGFFN